MKKNNNIGAVYCKNKFTYLKIDVEKRLLYNCHKAYPHQINSQWLKNNKGKLFNTDTMLAERQQMLQGIKNKSCSYQCYSNEDCGLPSLRQKIMKDVYTLDYTDPYSNIETLDVVLHSDCNLTCLYCNGMFSSAWRKEIDKNGEYANIKKNWNDVYSRVSQKKKLKTEFFELFLKEIDSMHNLKQVIITGGEPFLYNYLDEFIEYLNSSQKKNINVMIVTGLGVGKARFRTIIKKIKNYKNATISISAEGIEKHYELVRQGNTFQTFREYIDLIKEYNINFKFICTISNLSLFGLYDFYKMYNNNYNLTYNTCNQPFFLKKNIIDEESKNIIKKQWQKNNDEFSSLVLQGLDTPYTINEKKFLKTYVLQLEKNKNVNFEILPKSFLYWLNN